MLTDGTVLGLEKVSAASLAEGRTEQERPKSRRWRISVLAWLKSRVGHCQERTSDDLVSTAIAFTEGVFPSKLTVLLEGTRWRVRARQGTHASPGCGDQEPSTASNWLDPYTQCCAFSPS